MKITFSTVVSRHLAEIKMKNPKLFKKISSKLHLFKENPHHPSLRNHKLSGKNRWSISIEMNLRMLYYMQEDEAIFFMIGTHDQVYRK